MDKLVKAINISGTNIIIVSKIDIMKKIGIYKYYYKEEIISYNNFEEFKENIINILKVNCELCKKIYFSGNPYVI